MSIKPEELRIGNLIQVNEETGKVQTVVVSLANMGVSMGYVSNGKPEYKLIKYNDCEPIVLTEEWLSKFDFFYDDQEWHKDYLHINELAEGGYYYSGAYDAIVDLSYVHQLQNLAFMINGKDLTLDEG